MRIKGKHSIRFLVVLGLLAASLVLGVSFFSGWLGSDERKRPDRNAEELAEAPTVGATPTPTAPPPLVIRGEEIPLAPGMSYKKVAGTWCNQPCPATDWAWYVEYDPSPDPYDPNISWLVFDDGYHLVQNEILPHHRDEFKPILDALDPPYDPFASPPAYIFIRAKQVALAPGMTVSGGGLTICEGAPCPSGHFTEVRYDSIPSEAGWSSLVFDENYSLRGSHVRPEDEEEFQPLLAAFAEP